MALQVWLPLNGDLHNQGLRQNLNIIGTDITFSNNGKIGKCADFNGTSSRIYIPNFSIDNQWSYGCWVNTPTSDTRGWELVIILNNSGSDADSQLAFWIHQKENRIESLANTKYTSTIPYTPYYNSWHHFFATYNGTVLTSYIDGTIVKTQTITNEKYTGTNLTIGARCTAVNGSSFSSFFQGSLNDVRIYDHCLSQKEVKEIAKGLILHYKLNNNGLSNPNLLPCGGTYIQSSPWTTTLNRVDGYAWVTNSAFRATPGKTYTISVKCDGTLANTHGQSANPSVKSWSFWLYISNSNTTKSWQTGAYDTPINLTSANHNYRKIGNTHVWTYTLSSTQEYISLRTNSYSNGTDNVTIHWWDMKVEEGDSFTGWSPNFSNTSIIYDSSGYNNNGTIVGSLEAITPSPRYSCATSFDNKEYIIHKLPENMYQATYSFWVKASSYTSYGAIYMPYQSPSAGTSPWFAINTESCKVWAYFGNNSPHYTKGSGTMSLNEWHHCVYVWNNGVAQWYVDGEKNGNSVTYTGRTFIQNTTNATIGNSYTGTSWNGTPFNGQISDFRIYATALTPAQIKELYETSKIIDGTTVKARDLEVSA